MKLAIVQRAVKEYRLPLYFELSKQAEVKFFYGKDIPGTKTLTRNIDGINAVKCKSWNVKVCKRWIAFHVDLVSQLRRFSPDAILVEGESHFVGALLCKIYQYFYGRKVPLMKWCFIDLPGEERTGFRFLIKYYFQRVFDVFVLYSTYSAKALSRYGIENERGFVTVNVGNVERYVQEFHEFKKKSGKCEKKRFKVGYVGNFEQQKKFNLFLAVAKELSEENIDFCVAGDDSKRYFYENEVKELGLGNIFFLGHLSNMTEFYCDMDVIYIPGRGGMVISEALAFACPVIVHAADGTENDLVINDTSGFRIKENTEEVARIILKLKTDRSIGNRLGCKGQELVSACFSTKNMAEMIMAASRFGIEKRRV